MASVETAVQVPIGCAAELNAHLIKHPEGHLGHFVPVKNCVIAVNSDVYSPLNLRIGKPSPLGVFITSSQSDGIGIGFECWEAHHRSALAGRMLFSDKQGRLYRDIDFKGVGNMFTTTNGVGVSPPVRRWGGSHRGLMSQDEAFFDYRMSEKFSNAGIRVPRVLGIIELEEVVVHGSIISIKEARR